MTEAPPPPAPSPAQAPVRPAARLLILPLAGAITIADQVTKLAVDRFVPAHATIPVVSGLLNLTHVRNTGAAFGLLNAAEFPFKPVVMVVVAALALGAITFYALSTPARSPAAYTGFALILGGACGNLIDRVRAGYVIDFIDVYWREYHFWAFNVADAAITVGAALLIFDMLRTRPHVSEAR